MSISRKPRKDGRKRKIRTDAKLLNLPAKDRALVAGWVQESGVSLALQRIASVLHIETSQSALYAALAFWESEEENDKARAMALAQLRHEEADKTMNSAQFMAALDRRMAMLKAAAKDDKGYNDARYLIIADESARTKAELEKVKLKLKERGLSQKDREIALAIEKFQWDGAKEALAKLKELKSIAADRTLNDDQKIEQVRLRLWGAVPKEMEGKA